MSLFGDIFSSPITGAVAGGLLLGPVGAIGGGLIGASNAKDNANSAIDAQMTPAGSPPALLDPNSVGSPNTSGSPYAQLAYANNNRQAMQANDASSTQAGGLAAQARANLASRGGLTSGAGERVAMAANTNAAGNRQANNANLMNQNSNIAMNDENQRINTYNQIRQQNQNMQNSVYGSNMLANSTLNANRPQGLLGLGVLGL